MSLHPCFSTLERALSAYRVGMSREALAMAEAAWQLTQQIPGAPPQSGMVLSWYGFLLGTQGRNVHRGLTLCREAVKKVFWEPRAFCHLAHLELLNGGRRRALMAVQRGLELSPEDKELLELRDRIGVRKSPPVPFLDRGHPVNRIVGRMLHKPNAAVPPPEAAPAAPVQPS